MKHKKLYMSATFGLALGAFALAPVLPSPINGAVNVYATEGTSVEVANYADLYDAVVNGDAAVVTLTSDITELVRDMEVPAGRIVTIDLNGHTLTVRDDMKRGITNRGVLTITGNGLIRNGDNTFNNESYGIVDNYGTLYIDHTTFEENGAGYGSSIRNNAEDAVIYINEGTKISVLNAVEGNVGVSSTLGMVYIADGVEISSVSDTYFPIQVKNGGLVIGTEGSENPAKITGESAGLYLFGNSNVIINNAEIHSVRDEAISVATNNADLTINDGKFTAPYGGVYIYTTVEKDAPLVKINGGEFSGEWASVVSTNIHGDVEKWAIDVKGGVYAGTRIREYVSDGYSAYKIPHYFENGWNGYAVEPTTVENIPQSIYMKKGTQANIGLSETALKYATLTMDKDNILVIDGDTITSGKTGIVVVTIDLNDGSEPIETVVYSYENLLSVELIDESELGADEVALFNAGLKENENKVGYLDVNMARIIDGVEFDRLAESEEPVTVLVDMPELPAVAEGYKRSFKLYEYVDGQIVEVENATFNTSENKLGFETTTFSQFLITYTDTEIPVVEPDEPVVDPSEPNHPVVPKDDTFDFDDPADVDPLGETYTQGAKNKGVGVPNTAESDGKSASELNVLVAMMLGSVITTAAVVSAKKAYRKR